MDSDYFEQLDKEYYDRNMGHEIHYIWTSLFYCPKCENELEVSIHGWEYPIGILNFQDIETENCDVIENPILEIDYNHG